MIILHDGTGGDLSHVQAMASIDEGFALFDYVRIDQDNRAWIGQILEPNRNISIVNSNREDLFSSGKQCIGIIKNIKSNVVFSTFARALRTGELFIVETLRDHLENSNAPNRNQGESSRGTLSSLS
ncbi:MAG: hypothetical protein AAGA75_11900 [Cyanobacteria bacterium P01_E01_bin.6]